MWQHLPAQPGAEGHRGDPPRISGLSGARFSPASCPAGTGTGSGAGRAGSGGCEPVGVLPSGVSRSKMHLRRKPHRVTTIPSPGPFASSLQQPGLPSRGISSVKEEISALQSAAYIPFDLLQGEGTSHPRGFPKHGRWAACRLRPGCCAPAPPSAQLGWQRLKGLGGVCLTMYVALLTARRSAHVQK